MKNRKDIMVSVIVPTFNSSKNIEVFLKSFLNSTYKVFEIIINDSLNSDDDTFQIVKRYKNKGLKIVYIRENISMAQARKKGSNYARGKIFLHLDSDMKVSRDLLKECVDLIN